jgi:predicted transcriptional regulator
MVYLKMEPKRSKAQIIARILEICHGQGASKAMIVSDTGMNHKTIRPHLAALTENGLLEMYDKDPVIYKITSKGTEALVHIRALEILIPELKVAMSADCPSVP